MPDSSIPAIAEMIGVSHFFGRPPGPVFQALQDVNLRIEENDIVALVGPSGCGKSTIMRILVGLIEPTTGQVLAHGKPLHGVHPGATMVFQNFALFPWLTVAQNILLGLHHVPLDEAEKQRRLTESMHLIGLEGYDAALPKELSGGMKQRVGIARALISHPEILCLDEPFTALDVLTGETLRNEISRLCHSGDSSLKSVVIVTHNIEEAVFLARRIVVLAAHPGRVQLVLENPLPHPRVAGSPEFQALVEKVHGILTNTVLPDGPTSVSMPAREPGGPRQLVLTPLPAVGIAEILGLLSLLGVESEDLFELAARLRKEFGALLLVVKAAEMLGFVETPGQDVIRTPAGEKVVRAGIAEQRRILQEHMQHLKIFELLLRMIQAAPESHISEERLLQELAFVLPNEKPRVQFRTLIGWGRYAELISYDAKQRFVRRFEKKYLGRPPVGRQSV